MMLMALRFLISMNGIVNSFCQYVPYKLPALISKSCFGFDHLVCPSVQNDSMSISFAIYLAGCSVRTYLPLTMSVSSFVLLCLL